MNYCQWFARCTRIATRTRQHPILGAVPICRQCDQNIEAMDAKVAARS